jgi:hypothetical protein
MDDWWGGRGNDHRKWTGKQNRNMWERDKGMKWVQECKQECNSMLLSVGHALLAILQRKM